MEQSDDDVVSVPSPQLAAKQMMPFFKRKPCNARLEELAKPKKRLVLSVWETYIHLFPPEKREAVRQLLQELYAMTPEQTAKYFEEVNELLKKLAARARLRRRLQKKYKKKVWRSERNRAYHKFEKLLKQGMMYAYKHSSPSLVSPRLRNMADVILEQLCDIRGVGVPDRSSTDRQSQFLISVADWLAVAIEHVYYQIQVRKNQEFDLIEEQIRAMKEMEKKMKKSKSSKGSGMSKKSNPEGLVAVD